MSIRKTVMYMVVYSINSVSEKCMEKLAEEKTESLVSEYYKRPQAVLKYIYFNKG